MRRILLMVPVAVIAAGCASQESGDAASKAEAPAPAMEEPAPAVMETTPVMAEPASVSGTMGCGHCNYGVTPACSAALQTADGVVWILEEVDEQSELFQQRKELGMVSVTGTAREEAGVHYLAVTAYETVPAGESEG
jgi:hypothetical protein